MLLLAALTTSAYSSSGVLQGHEPPTSATLSVGLTTRPHWPLRGCVRGCVEECCGIFFVSCAYPDGGRRPVTNKNKHGRPGGEGKLIMEWEFINSVTIQLAKIVFQNFLCEEIKIKMRNMTTS